MIALRALRLAIIVFILLVHRDDTAGRVAAVILTR
jgi:hypothetical protein